MFASQDSGTTRKVFQKPNILRRKSKAKRGTQKCIESPEEKVPAPAQIKGENQHITGNLNARVLSTEYLIMSHGSNLGVHNTAAFNESLQSIVTQDKTPNAAFFSNENTLEAYNRIRQNVAIKNECTQPSKEFQSLLANDFTLCDEQQNHTFFKHELYTSKPTPLEQPVDYIEEDLSSLNIESFLVDSPNKQSSVIPNDSFNLTAKKTETEVANKWCLNFMSDDSKDMVTPNFYEGAQIKICKANTDTNDLLAFNNKTNSSQKATNMLEQDIIQSCLNSRVIKYKCDMPNCTKSFWNEARLQKHKSIHSRLKTYTPFIVECPVKKVTDEGVEQRCSMLFPSRDILVKHLNEDHVPEDAAYRCAQCGRRFWWATGMRTHAQSTCTRMLACTWPGCGRVFRQPCRLREHARAHTGDRPYPCDYPNCGWAFRSASKLVRHARRHTGERRHECAACGRAFLRREHLRDHAARHHASGAQEKRPCTHDGCEQTFANMSSLYMHLKKVHQVENNKPSAPKKPRTPKPRTPKLQDTNKPPRKPRTPKPKKETEATNMLVMTLDGGSIISYDIGNPTYTLSDVTETANASAVIIPEEGIVDSGFTGVNVDVNEGLNEDVNEGLNEDVNEGLNEDVNKGVNEEVNEDANDLVDEDRVAEGAVFGYDLEGRCARTHCTWPLQTHTEPQQDFNIEEDTQVEQSEGSESNIYTVRSDLFLHGNVLINEDSDFIIRESSHRVPGEQEETSDTGQLDGLDLIDAHPTIDLMQEELSMYAVDESSFRVFLMNGEELS